jgi:hypothetical protein
MGPKVQIVQNSSIVKYYTLNTGSKKYTYCNPALNIKYKGAALVGDKLPKTGS